MKFDGTKIKTAREKRSNDSGKIMSGEKLCYEIAKLNGSLSRQSLSNYETGKSTPDAETLAFLAMALNVPVGYFFIGK